VILYLPSERGMSIDEVTDLLYHRSGPLGVSGMSNAMRNLLASPAREAADAVDLLVYRIGRDLGSLTAAARPRCPRVHGRHWGARSSGEGARV
jgi:acetate kinase